MRVYVWKNTCSQLEMRERMCVSMSVWVGVRVRVRVCFLASAQTPSSIRHLEKADRQNEWKETPRQGSRGRTERQKNTRVGKFLRAHSVFFSMNEKRRKIFK